MVPTYRKPNGWAVPTNRLEDLFERVFTDMDKVIGGTAAASQAMVARGMPLSVWSDAENIYVEAEVPGAAADSVEATVHEDKLFIGFERKPEEGRQYLHNSRQYGKLQRVITLPEPVDAKSIQATLNQGVLTLVLPKSPEAQPRKITIQNG